MSDPNLSGDEVLGGNHHDPHHRHNAAQEIALGDGSDVGDGDSLHFDSDEEHIPDESKSAIDPNDDPVRFIEAALLRLTGDVGVLAEEGVIHAFSILQSTDMPAFLRMRHLAKVTNQACSLTTLDKMVKTAPAGSDVAVAALKSAISGINATYENIAKSAKQFVDLTQANVEAATSQAIIATKKKAA